MAVGTACTMRSRSAVARLVSPNSAKRTPLGDSRSSASWATFAAWVRPVCTLSTIKRYSIVHGDPHGDDRRAAPECSDPFWYSHRRTGLVRQPADGHGHRLCGVLRGHLPGHLRHPDPEQHRAPRYRLRTQLPVGGLSGWDGGAGDGLELPGDAVAAASGAATVGGTPLPYLGRKSLVFWLLLAVAFVKVFILNGLYLKIFSNKWVVSFFLIGPAIPATHGYAHVHTGVSPLRDGRDDGFSLGQLSVPEAFGT